jgi:predicted nucleic acid-binding protein
VQEGIRSAQFKLVWSAVLDLENAENPDVERSKAIADWRFFATHDVNVTEQIETLADTLQIAGVKSMDALHLACAISANTGYFLTTDKGILRKMNKDKRICVLDPLDFLREQTGVDDEN